MLESVIRLARGSYTYILNQQSTTRKLTANQNGALFLLSLRIVHQVLTVIMHKLKALSTARIYLSTAPNAISFSATSGSSERSTGTVRATVGRVQRLSNASFN